MMSLDVIVAVNVLLGRSVSRLYRAVPRILNDGRHFPFRTLATSSRPVGNKLSRGSSTRPDMEQSGSLH